MTVFLGVPGQHGQSWAPSLQLCWLQVHGDNWEGNPAFSKFMGNAIYFMIKLHRGNAAFCIRQFSSGNCCPGGLLSSLHTRPIYNTAGTVCEQREDNRP